jgi:hypothetical protein
MADKYQWLRLRQVLGERRLAAPMHIPVSGCLWMDPGVKGRMLTLDAKTRYQYREQQPAKVNLEVVTMPLSAALLAVSREGISFATPGHRCGNSCSPDGKLHRNAG